MSKKPTKTKEEFITVERAAEREVVKAEFELRKAEITNDPKQIAAARKAVDDKRKESLRIRGEMQTGLAAWHRYDSEQELARTARELGVKP
jgi:hypothetical protein